MYDKKNDAVRPNCVNGFFALIPPLASVLSVKKNGNLKEDCLESSSVPETGFEPAHPFGRYHLKVVRLPISPPGQGGKCKMKNVDGKM